jgi:hypothetical protein
VPDRADEFPVLYWGGPLDGVRQRGRLPEPGERCVRGEATEGVYEAAILEPVAGALWGWRWYAPVREVR